MNEGQDRKPKEDQGATAIQSPAPVLKEPFVFLCGPTAVGKSEVVLLLAEKLSGEIVSMDSMQVYRGMDIGTAKPSSEERGRVPHHMIDVVEPADAFDAGKFVQLAHSAVAEIQEHARLPILCGGTGLYFKALLEGLGSAPSVNALLRAELERTPLPDLLRELAERDPKAYEQIDRQNPRRVIRAVEVTRLTGKPFSSQRAVWQTVGRTSPAAAGLFGLSRSVGDLRRRINNRVESIFQRGLVAETERLLKEGLAKNRTALQALGYRQVAEYLEGARSLAETKELVKIRTNQFAKRQLTWFRRQLQLRWIHVEENALATATAEQIARDYSLSRTAHTT